MPIQDDLDAQVQARKASIAGHQREIARLQAIAGAWWIDDYTKAQARELLPSAQDALNKTQQELADAENKYFESTGQYEKLLSGDERDAFMGLNALFKNYNLESLAGKIFDYVKNGYSADTISILLQDTSEYRERFSANEARRKAGLPVLSPAEYLATESAYKQVVEASGLPRGFLDKPSDFNDLLSRNISPSELQKRVDLAVQETTLAPEFEKQALKAMGIKESEMVAYWLDKDRALPYLTQAAATARIGAQALSQGLSFDTSYASELAKQGVTADAARQGYAAIADEMTTLSTLGSIYGEEWNQRESERAMFEGSAAATQKKKRLASQERGAFSGAAGGARGGLSQKGGAR